MPFGAHETMEVHEILDEKINLINHLNLYAGFVRDANLRQMLDRQLQDAVRSYDRLVGYTHDYAASNQTLPPYAAPQLEPNQIQYGLRQPMDRMPQMQGGLDDRQIAAALLSCHKNMAKNQMAKALECADPNLRQMLIDGAVSCANQAYEVFYYLNRQGVYQVPTMNDHTAKTFLHAYQPAGQSTGYAAQHTGMGASQNYNTGIGELTSVHSYGMQSGPGMMHDASERQPARDNREQHASQAVPAESPGQTMH
jgi:spore coat protein CotF